MDGLPIDIYIAASSHSPEVDFRFSEDKLRLSGESFPENAKAFYSPIFEPLINYLQATKIKKIEFDFDLKYFNSATTRLIYKMFEYFSNAINDYGHSIKINFILDEEDEMMRDFFEEMKSEYSNICFNCINK